MKGLTMNSGAYAYGRLLGVIQKAVGDMFKEIGTGYQDVLESRPMTMEQVEALRERRYRRRIEHEREIGKAQVDAIVRKVRLDLGLENR